MESKDFEPIFTHIDKYDLNINFDRYLKAKEDYIVTNKIKYIITVFKEYECDCDLFEIYTRTKAKARRIMRRYFRKGYDIHIRAAEKGEKHEEI